ncbi:hypothetical protein BHM03_00031196 [Ensete ventricosum]|nr:hypothetical protein BHM03_00031196 [Ensete ventricosum]
MSEPTWPAPSCGFFTSPVDAVAHETLLPLQLRTRRRIPGFVRKRGGDTVGGRVIAGPDWLAPSRPHRMP